MRSSLTARIFMMFLGGWLAAQLVLAGATWSFGRAARLFEQHIYQRTASTIAERLALEESNPDAVGKIFRELRGINPDLEPYLLDGGGRITDALAPNTIGRRILPELPDTARALSCGMDPASARACTAVSIAPFRFREQTGIVYLVAAHGIGRFFTSFQSFTWLGSKLATGLIISLFVMMVFSGLVASYLTRSFHELSRLLAAYRRDDFSERFRVSVSDELGNLGHALDALADTVQARRMELQASIERRSKLLAAIIHDLRRPVQSIKLLLERIGRSPEAGMRPDDHYSLRESLNAERLLLNALPKLDASPPSAEERVPLPVNDFLRRALHEIEPLILQRSQTLSLNLESGLPLVRARREELFRIFLNLIDNASRYTPRAGALHVRSFQHDGILSVEIQDTGIGISPDEAEKIFEPSFRGANAEQHNPGGSGLGLSITRSIVQSLGGSIHALPGESRGTRFLLQFPTEENSIVTVQEKPPAVPSQSSGASKRLEHVLFYRSGYLFEGVAATALGLLFAFSFGQLETSPGLGQAFLAAFAALAGLSATQAALTSSNTHRFPSRAVLWFSRFAMFAVFGLALQKLGTFFFRPPATANELYLAQELGLLWGLSLFFRPIVTEGIAGTLFIGVPSLNAILARGFATELSTFLLTVLAAAIISGGVYFRRFLSLRFRTGVFVFILLFNSVVFQAIAVGTGFQTVFFEHSPFLTIDVLKAVADRLPKSLNSVSPTPGELLSSPLARALLQIHLESPRLNTRLLRGGSTLVAPFFRYSEKDSRELPAELLSSINAEHTTEPFVRVSNGIHYGVIPVPGLEDVRLLVSADESSSHFVMRKVAGSTLLSVLVLVGALVFALSIAVSSAAFRSVSRRISEMSEAVRQFSRGGRPPEASTTPERELARVTEDIAALCSQIESVLERLSVSEHDTLRLIHGTRVALESQIASIEHSAAHPLNAAPQSGALTSLVARNEEQTRILGDVFEYVGLVRSNAKSSREAINLHDFIEDLILATVARQMDPGRTAIRYELDPSVTVHSDPRALHLLLRCLLLELSATSSIEILARQSDHATEIFFLGSDAAFGEAGRHSSLRWLLAEQFAAFLDAELARNHNETRLTIPNGLLDSASQPTEHIPA